MTLPPEVWASDPEALQALETFEDGVEYGAVPIAEIRCMGGHGSTGKSSRVVADVWMTRRDSLVEERVIRVFYWPDGLRSRTKTNRKAMYLFLDKAGDLGLFSCAEHGTWQFDLREVRRQVNERYPAFHKVIVPVWPRGTSAPHPRIPIAPVGDLTAEETWALRQLVKKEVRGRSRQQGRR